MFLCRRLLFCHVRADIFMQHVTVLAVLIFCYLFCFLDSFQMFVSNHGWRSLPVSVKPDLPSPESLFRLKVARNSFQHLYFDRSLQPLLIT